MGLYSGFNLCVWLPRRMWRTSGCCRPSFERKVLRPSLELHRTLYEDRKECAGASVCAVSRESSHGARACYCELAGVRLQRESAVNQMGRVREDRLLSASSRYTEIAAGRVVRREELLVGDW